MGDKVYVQCQTCGKVHRVDVGDAQLKSGARPAAPKAEEAEAPAEEQF